MAARRTRRSTTRAAALALPRRDGVRMLPSRGSVVAGLALFAAAVAAFFGARESSVFAVDAIVVHGASPKVQQQVGRSLRGLVGTSLLKVDGGIVSERVDAVPWVASARFDRSFPHTLVVTVKPERPVAVLRSGAHAWLLSSRARVLQELPLRAQPGLPRVWVGAGASPTIGSTLGDTKGGRAARALAPLDWVRFPARVAAVAVGDGELTLVLRSGVELRLGDAADLKLKLAIARRVLHAIGPAGRGTYVDVSVPERPVAGTGNPQVGG